MPRHHVGDKLHPHPLLARGGGNASPAPVAAVDDSLLPAGSSVPESGLAVATQTPADSPAAPWMRTRSQSGIVKPKKLHAWWDGQVWQFLFHR